MRLLGILTGSALAVTAMLLAFGTPELAVRDDNPVSVAPAETLPPDREPVAAAARAPEAPPLPEASPMQATTNETVDADNADTAPAPRTVADDSSDPVIAPLPSPPPATQSPNWHAFWSPFRSELAADGFVAGLQRTTGLDYRVVKLKPGIYEVAFAYTDMTDREDKLRRISVATGLDLGGG